MTGARAEVRSFDIIFLASGDWAFSLRGGTGGGGSNSSLEALLLDPLCRLPSLADAATG